jgi:GNAT superfamily N-acetyltransferase
MKRLLLLGVLISGFSFVVDGTPACPPVPARGLENESTTGFPDALGLEVQGEAVGFSWLMFDTSTGQIENWGTGIRREYRRQGLAWALKLAGIRWAMDHGAKRIITGNHAGNEGMRAINQRLGFEQQLGLYQMEMRSQDARVQDF